MARKAGRDEALILALARGLTVRSAAKASGYSERHAHRRLNDPAFRGRVGEARGAIVGRAVAILSAASTEAAWTLKKLLASQADQVRLAAARAILEIGPKLHEATELAERIEALERLQEPRTGQTCNGQPVRAHDRGAQ